MLWLQCLHDWIWYFGHGCRQRWRSLGMCDHMWALWPHDCMSSSLVWVRRHGPSHPWTSPPGPLCDKPQPTATHSQTRKWQPSGRMKLRSLVNMERFPFYGSLEGAVIASAESGRLCGCGHVMFMSISRSDSVPLWSEALELQTPAAICWTAICLAELTQLEWMIWERRNRNSQSAWSISNIHYKIIFKSVLEPLQVSIMNKNFRLC